MKKILASLIVLARAFMASAPADAAPKKPTKQDILVMKHNLLTLWNMGIMNPQQVDTSEALHTSISFLIRGQMNESCEMRSDYPARFTNLPPNYDLFFPKAVVEDTAFLVFNGFIGEARPTSMFLGAEGWYVDSEKYYADIEMDSDSFLPSYCTIEAMMQQADGTLILNGKVRRFKQLNSAEEVLFGSAPFMARFAPTERGWQLVTFIFTEEAMG